MSGQRILISSVRMILGISELEFVNKVHEGQPYEDFRYLLPLIISKINFLNSYVYNLQISFMYQIASVNDGVIRQIHFLQLLHRFENHSKGTVIGCVALCYYLF